MMEHDGHDRVAIWQGESAYPVQPPYSPAEPFPEYPWPAEITREPNPVYAGFRELLRLMRLDEARFGTPAWNPLAGLVQPGDTVVLKPNLVREFRESSDDHANCVTTHGSLIRAAADYAFIAMQGRGRLIVADAPHNDATFAKLVRITGLQELQDFYRRAADFHLEFRDLRPEEAEKRDGVIVGHRRLAGDPEGYQAVDLAGDSMFTEVNHLCHLLYGSEYDRREICSHHRDGRHEYLISRTVLLADCVIGLPKLKTHKKVGLTVNLKNLVGINGNKNWLPHHREGTPSQGGDQFADDAALHRLERRVVAGFKQCFPRLGPLRPLVAGPIKAVGKRVFGDTNVDTIRSGNWYGNDTTWRMALDLNRILMYADASGRLHDEPVRRFASFVDGIIGGEGNGPLDPQPKSAGVLVGGFNPVSVDLVCGRLMGFDYRKVPMLLRAFDAHPRPLIAVGPEDVQCRSNQSAYNGPLSGFAGECLGFAPHFGWVGHVELTETQVGV